MSLIVILFLILSFTAVDTVHLQEQTEVENPQKPERRKAEYPWYWNRPYENIDNFENSSLGKDRSSITKGSINKSNSAENNVDINKQIEEKINEDREKQLQYEIEFSSSIGLSVDADGTIIGTQATNEAETIEGTISNNKTITWVDENGVIHVTNDPTEVYKKSK